ncbi:MAG: RNA polymerase factor sigma-32 [Bdellovibrionaceae bacterium]|nr:RNA polymerase factor sigma-32 [Pseudobdellovibrionaceae bacterium]
MAKKKKAKKVATSSKKSKTTPKAVAAKKKVTKKVTKKSASAAPKALVTTHKHKAAPQKKLPSQKTQAVHVKAEIVDNAIVPRAPMDLAPLADGLQSYLANLHKYPLLTREQEEIIAKRYYENKNPRDAEILVTSNLRFVVKVAADYAKFGHKLLDLIQEGNVGLMHAVKEFNPYKGVRLITYAVWWIRGYIQEYLMRQHSMVRIGTTQNQRKLFYHLQKEKNMLDQLGQEPTVKLLATKLGVPEEDVRMMEERMSGGDISLDAPVSGDNTTQRIEMETGNEDTPIDEELARRETLHMLEDKIQQLRPNLSDKEILILEERILADNPITLQDIGEKWGVTREAVRQMEARLINKIKEEVLKDS